MFVTNFSECAPLNPFWHLYCNQHNKQFQPNESVLALWLSTRGLNLRGRYDLQEGITSDGVWVWVLLRTNRLAMFKAWEPKAKLLRSSWNWNLVKPSYHSLAIHCAKSAERHWLLVGATLCNGNPPNVHKIWPERTEKLHSSHWGNCKFCDLDGRKLLNQLTLDCGKVHRA